MTFLLLIAKRRTVRIQTFAGFGKTLLNTNGERSVTMTRTSKQGTRKYELHITLTEEENQKLIEWAQQAHMSRPAYVRSVLFRKEPQIIYRTPMEENKYLAIMDEFGKIGSKLSDQEINMRETDRLSDDLENGFTGTFEEIHEVCIKLEQWMGV